MNFKYEMEQTVIINAPSCDPDMVRKLNGREAMIIDRRMVLAGGLTGKEPAYMTKLDDDSILLALEDRFIPLAQANHKIGWQHCTVWQPDSIKKRP